MVFYLVTAKFNEEKIKEFYQKLTDGTIQNQKPDGQEIVDSMKRAKITSPHTIQWSEMCFCQKPLAHERETVYDNYFSHLTTQIIPDYVELDGELFFEYLEKKFRKLL